MSHSKIIVSAFAILLGASQVTSASAQTPSTAPVQVQSSTVAQAQRAEEIKLLQKIEALDQSIVQNNRRKRWDEGR